jgi:adenine-specific DNA-methyltransferase
MYNKDDKDGRGKYRLFPLQKTGGPGPETTYDYVDNKGKEWKCPAKGWRMTKVKLKELENDNRLYFEGNSLSEKAYWNERDNEGKIANNLWDDIFNLQGSNSEYLNFSGQKPEALIQRIITTVTAEKEIVLDFHLGSGTTCAVAHKMGRQYIGIEQLEYEKHDAIKRLQDVIKGDDSGISKKINWSGGGSFVSCELAPVNDVFVGQIRSAKNASELKEIWKEMKERAFLSYKVNPSEIDKNADDFSKLSLEDQKKFLMAVLDKNMLYVPYSEIEDKVYKISKEDKSLNEQFYSMK